MKAKKVRGNKEKTKNNKNPFKILAFKGFFFLVYLKIVS